MGYLFFSLHLQMYDLQIQEESWPSELNSFYQDFSVLWVFIFKPDVLCLAQFFSADFPVLVRMTSQICFKILGKS